MLQTRRLLLILVAGALAFVLWRLLFAGADDRGQASQVTEAPAKHRSALPDVGEWEGTERARIATTESANPQDFPLLVEVRTAQDDAPLAEAEIVIERRGIGRTDAQGKVQGQWPADLERGRLIVYRAGYLRWEAEVQPQREPFRVALVRTGTLRGRIVSSDGSTDWAGMSVLAHPEDMPADQAIVAEALAARSQDVVIVKTDPTGWFEFKNLPANRPFQLHAGGPGWISPQPLRRVQTGDFDVQVKVRKFFGVQLGLRGPEGGPLRTSDSLFDETPHGMLGPQQVASDGISPDAAVLLLVFPQWPEIRRFGWRLHLHCLDGDDPEPLPTSIVIPGYQPTTTDVRLWRVWRSIPVQEIRLEPLAKEWGQITVTLQNLPAFRSDEWPTRGSLPPQIILHLQPLNLPRSAHQETGPSGQFPFSALIREPRNGTHTLTGVPAAAYRVGWRHALDNLSILPGVDSLALQDLIVWPDQVSEISFDFSRTGAVRVLSRPDLPMQRGWLGLQIGTLDGSQARIHFAAPPYLIYGLTPGIYRFSRATDRPLPTGAPAPEAVEVQVQAGFFTEVRLPPPE